MLRRIFNPNQPYQVVTYLRMSSDKQNPKSPQQQEDTIRDLIKRLRLPWVIVKSYTDSAISGRHFKKRAGLQQMLRDVRTGSIKIDLILVDTFERFGRADEAATLRTELRTNHGILILTADTSFSDPTSVSGEFFAAFEQSRGKEDNRVKAHNLLRGKRDVVKLKHWPGGSPPFGYRLESVLKTENGRQVLDFSVLVPKPETCWIIRDLFQRAYETAEGCQRLTQWYNQHPNIPDQYKPITVHTINRWLKNEIYKGLMIWERQSADVIQDRRVVERNTEDILIHVPDFCEPLIDPKIWDAVNAVRSARQAKRNIPAESSTNKLIAPLAGGIAIKNILSGLVVCGSCGLAMVPATSGPYVTKTTGETKRYATYKCSRAGTGACDNSFNVPIEWLNDTVVQLLLKRLFITNP